MRVTERSPLVGRTLEELRLRDTSGANLLAIERPARFSVDVIRQLGSQIPVLGVCLGHQAIGYAFGGAIVRAPQLMHGKVSPVLHDGKGIFKGISQPFPAGRYHSLIVGDPLPDALEPAAHTDDGTLMGLRHRTLPIHGVQFHPESVLTGEGHQMLRNFLEL